MAARMPKRLLTFIALAWLALPLAAQTNGRQLREFGAEADAFNRQDPLANAYRAGYYNGYLNGIVDALEQDRSVCLNACRCDLGKLAAAYLDAHPEVINQPAPTWLVPLLRTTYPCN